MTHTLPISVKGIVIEGSGVWLRKNERNEWELPGGKLDPGEQPEQTVVRELFEELGFVVEAEELVSAYVYTIKETEDESKGVLVLSYRCECISKVGDFELEGEAGVAEFQLVPITGLDELAMPDFYKEAIQRALP